MASVAFQDKLVVHRGSFGGPPGPIFKQSWVCVVCVVCPLECVLALVYSNMAWCKGYDMYTF